MARESQVFEAVPVNGERPADDDDILNAFDNWVDGLKDSESPGHIRAFRVPLDSQGNASHSASGQVRLGTWPVDQFTFDTLCDKIVKEFMLPTESMMAVRLIGTLAGKSGVRFNKLVTLQRPNILAGPAALPKDGVAEIMRAVQESNERMVRMIAEMRGPQTGAPAGGGDELMRTVAMMQALNKPVTDMMGPMLAALAGRPVGAGGGGGSMREMLETMMMFDKFVGRRGGGGAPAEPDWMRMTTAVAGVAKPLLELAVANAATGTRTRKALPNPNAPQTAPVRPASAQPTPQPAPAQPAQPAQPVGHDLSKPSPLPAGSLAPNGPDITAPSDPEAQNMFAEMKKQIDALVEVARGGSDPVAVADLFFEQSMGPLNDDEYSKLAGYIESERFMSTLAIYNGSVKEHTVWFEAMRAQLVKHIQEADSDET